VGLLVCIMALLAERLTFRRDKGVYEKRCQGWEFLADLCPMGGVVSYRRLVGIEVQMPHTLFEVVGMMARIPYYPTTLGRLALLTCGPSPHSQ
jgi:hypothetical protein